MVSATTMNRKQGARYTDRSSPAAMIGLMHAGSKGGKGEAWPDAGAVAQWARHMRRLAAACRRCDAAPAFRLALEAEELARFVEVCDGDGLVVAGLRVRLRGIDAPEADQTCQDENGHSWPCGRLATRRLRQLVRAARRLELEVLAIDRYGRCMAVCRLDGVDVGARLVREGWAVCFGDGGEDYAAAEREAARSRRGIWRGAFEEPASFRRNAVCAPRAASNAQATGSQVAGAGAGRGATGAGDAAAREGGGPRRAGEKRSRERPAEPGAGRPFMEGLRALDAALEALLADLRRGRGNDGRHPPGAA